MAQGLELVQTADGEAAVDRIDRQIGALAGPVGGHEHGGQVTAGGMAAYLDAAGIEAQRIGVSPQPGQGGAGLRDDVVEGHRRAQIIADHGHIDPVGTQTLGDEVIGASIAALPVAAVQEHLQRSVAGIGREKVELVAFAVPVGQVQLAVAGGA